MANKRYDQFASTAPTTSRILLTADDTTGSLGKCTVQNILNLNPSTYDAVTLLRAAGSSIKAVSLNLNPFWWIGNSLGVSGVMVTQLIYLAADTYTGVWYLQASQGNYTANNYNGVCLYSQSAGTATLIASSTNDGNLFKAAANTLVKKDFSSPITVSAGAYYVGFLYSSSAQVGRPDFVAQSSNNLQATSRTFDMVGSNASQFTSSLRTSLPATINLATVGSGFTQPVIMGVY